MYWSPQYAISLDKNKTEGNISRDIHDVLKSEKNFPYPR